MSGEVKKIIEKNDSKTLSLKLKYLQEQLQEKEFTIENYESQLKKLFEDFNYNVDLIYERDQEIENLTLKLEELSQANQEKDAEIAKLQKSIVKIPHLEHENAILTKKLESFLSSDSKKHLAHSETKAPRLDYKSLIKDNRHNVSKKVAHLNGNFLVDKGYSKPHEDPSDTHYPELNFDLESRIKALEVENSYKEEKKSCSLSNSRIYEKSDDADLDIVVVRDKVKKQEKEISDLIKSLQVYKKQSDSNSRKKLKSYDSQILALNEDIERLRTGEFRSSSRNSIEETEKKYRPVVRPRSSFDKRLNN